MSRWRIAALLAAQRPAPGDPGAFVKRVSSQIVSDDYARAWLTLHPAHKAVAPRWTYFRLVLNQPALDETVEVLHTSHLVSVSGRWRWILTPERYEYYRAGACGARALAP